MTVAQELKPGEPLAKAFDRLVAKQGVDEGSPGVAIYVVQPGKWSFSKGYGLAVLRDKTPISPTTAFELASLSKPFTAIAVLILQDRGKLSIEDDVRKHLPELPQYDKAKPIRIVDLLQHVSGLPDYMDFKNVPAKHKDYWINDDYLGEFARQRKQFPLTFPTGSKYEYNNTNYMLLASIVARASGMSFGDFLRDEVFLPAEMNSTFVYETREPAPPELATASPAVGYEKAASGKWRAAWGLPPRRQEKLLTAGDGAIWTTLADMAKWDAALRAGKFLKPLTAKLMLQPSKTSDGETNQYGLGWSLYPDGSDGLLGYGHDGSWGGFRTTCYRYLAQDRSTVMLSNNGDFDPDAFWYELDKAIETHRPRK